MDEIQYSLKTTREEDRTFPSHYHNGRVKTEESALVKKFHEDFLNQFPEHKEVRTEIRWSK